MTDEEEFSACSQLKWTREGDAWILLYRRRRMGRVAPTRTTPACGESVKRQQGVVWSEWSGFSCSTYSEGKIVDAEALLAENDP